MIDLDAELKVIHNRCISNLISISKMCLVGIALSALASAVVLYGIITTIDKPLLAFLQGIPLVTTICLGRYYYREYRTTRGELLLLILGHL